ncbi:CRE-AQP-10 protein, partial [Aphelenchoides avenae]
KYKTFLAPVVVSTFLSVALAYVGVPGLNPVTVSSRLQGCPGLDLQWFIMTYWFAPVFRWLAAAALDRRGKRRPAKEATKTSQEMKKAKRSESKKQK